MNNASFGIIDYMAGLTTFSVDEQVLKRIAHDRGVLDYDPDMLTTKDRDLLLADILYTIYVSGKNIPSFQQQHGQYSTSTGTQTIDKEAIYASMMRIYRKWGDPKADTIQTSELTWIHENE